MENKKIKILNTNEEVSIVPGVAVTPEYFLRISNILLIGAIEHYVKGGYGSNIGISYLYQQNEDGVYEYAGTLDVRPVETELVITSIKNPLQLTFLGSIKSHNQEDQLKLVFEKITDYSMIPHQFRYIFGGIVTK